MTRCRAIILYSAVILPGLLGGCVGGLLGGGKPDNLYRFGASESVELPGGASTVPPTLLLERVRFSAEIDGDRMLAVHDGTARYIKGSRWVTAAPGLFTQAMAGSLRSHAPDLRITTMQSGTITGASLIVNIGRFEARYDDAAMAGSPTIAIEGDATLYGLSDRKVVAQKHFVTHAVAGQNRVGDIVAAFDRATTCYTAAVADWVATSTRGRATSSLPACSPSP